MANRLYVKAKQKFLEGAISWSDDDIRVILVTDGEYTANTNTDLTVDQIPLAARIGPPQGIALFSKSAYDGVADAADSVFVNVAAGPLLVKAAVIFKNTGDESTSPLIVYTDSATNLPVTPNGGNIVISWNPLGIFRF